MIDIRKIQKEVYKNKVNQGFNVTDINLDFCYLQIELAEAIEAYNQKLPNLGEELADIMIYILGLAEILKIDLEKELVEKMAINKSRKYVTENGILKRIK